MSSKSDAMPSKYTAEDVQRLSSITGAMDFCEFHDIDYGDLETMDDIKNLLLFKLKKQTARVPASTMMKKLIDEDIKKRQELSRVYGKLREFMNKVDDKLKMQVETAIPNCIAKITQYNQELVKDECPILVAGETSAGKSSLLNLLLGEEVLPYSLLSTTSTLCQLKNDDRKRAVVHLVEPDPTTGRDTIEFDLKRTGEDSIQDQLQKYANSKDRSADMYKFIEIFWPIPLLQGNVFIVDSPGVGENEFMNKVVMDYLPKAFAFIYVINSGNAGGVQEGRLETLLKILTEPKDRDQLQMFDPESAIFVFNKWDQVPVEEEEEVRKKTLEKLMRCWQGLTEKQVFYLSVTEAFRNLRAGAGFTEGYQKLLDGIQELVPKSLQTKLSKHHKWIEFFVGRLTYVIRTKIMNARRTMQEKQEKKEEITKRLDKLQRTSDDVLLKMTNTLDDRIEKIVDGLHQFLSSPTTMERLNEWNTSELPDGDDMDDIENRARTMIQKVITDEVRDWEAANHNFSKARQELYEYFKREFNFLDEELRRVEGSLQDDGFSGDGAQSALPQMTDEPLFTSTEKLVLGLTSPLWVPLALVATIIALPIIGGIAIREKVKQDKQLREYKQNKLGTMKKWFRETIEDLDSEALKERVVEIQLASLREIIEHIRKLIPRLIDADRKLIEDVVHDERSEGELVRIFSPLYKQCERLHGRIQLFHARYMRHFTIHKSDIIEKKWIASGSFAEVYDASVRINGEVQRVALKQMKEPLKYHNAGDYFMEEDTLMRLQGSHNIVGYIGTIYQTEPDERLIMITELCAKTLKAAIFKDHSKQSARLTGEAQRKAFAYVSSMASQLSVAIDYIHRKGFIHRDLKMDNILLTGNDEDVTKQDTLKLSDVGLTKAESQITGTLCGTIAYSAPEVLAGMAYNKQADLYSFGLILWEMWYGVKVFPDLHANHFEFMQYVLDGMRPEFTMRHRSPPPKEWREIMEQCWEAQPEKRPSASECYNRISKTATSSYNLQTAVGSLP